MLSVLSSRTRHGVLGTCKYPQHICFPQPEALMVGPYVQQQSPATSQRWCCIGKSLGEFVQLSLFQEKPRPEIVKQIIMKSNGVKCFQGGREGHFVELQFSKKMSVMHKETQKLYGEGYGAEMQRKCESTGNGREGI